MAEEMKTERLKDDGSPTPEEKGSRRSGEPFPYADLESAREVAQLVQSIGVESCKRQQVAAKLGISAEAGGFRSKVGAATKFGLVASRGGMLILTGLGKKVLDPQTQDDALVDSFLSVRVFKQLYEKLENVSQPLPSAIEQQLADLGVVKKQVSRARQVFTKSARYAGFYKLHPDRLMQPGRLRADSAPTDEPSTESQSETGPDRDSANGRGTQPSDQGSRQSLVDALFAARPKFGQQWGLTEWTEWLEALMPLLRMDYKDHPALRQITVTVTSPKASVKTDTEEVVPC